MIYYLASNPDADLEIADVDTNVVLFIVADRLNRCVGGIKATYDRHISPLCLSEIVVVQGSSGAPNT